MSSDDVLAFKKEIERQNNENNENHQEGDKDKYEIDDNHQEDDKYNNYDREISISVMNPSHHDGSEIVSLFSDKDLIEMQDLFPFIWSMTEIQLKWIKESEIKERFVSDSFKVNEALFVLIFLPQKDNATSSLHLKLLQLPPNISGMVLNVATKCKPLELSDSSIFDASYSRDVSFNLLEISFDHFKKHQFTTTDLFNVIECSITVLKPYKTDNCNIANNIHSFEYNLKQAKVRYFLDSNDGEIQFSVNTADDEWPLSLKWGLQQQSDDDDDEKKLQSETVDVQIRKRGDDNLPARMWLCCDGILFGSMKERTFSNKYVYSWSNKLMLHKHRFLGLNQIVFHGFVQVMDDGLDSTKLKIPSSQFDGEFEWKVSAKTLQIFNNASKLEPFWSKPFEIAGCIWSVIIYPKGTSLGSDKTSVQLCLLRLPLNVREVIVRFRVKLNELDDDGFICRFNYDNDRWRTGLMLTELFISLESFRLLCSIEMISMNGPNNTNDIDQEESKQDVEHPNEFELNLKPEELKIFYNPELTDKKYVVYRYFWLHGIRWKLACYPKGSGDDAESIGYTMVYLSVSEYPENVSKVKCRYWIICNEAMFGCAIVQLFEKKKNVSYGWRKELKHNRFQQLRDAEELNGVSFFCHIEILDFDSSESTQHSPTTKGELECKDCELLVRENQRLRIELAHLNKNMMNGLDQLLFNETNKKQRHLEGDMDFETQSKPMIDLWDDKISKILNATKMRTHEMEELRQEIDNLHGTVQKLKNASIYLESANDGDETNDTKVTQACTKCKQLVSDKKSLQNDNDKLRQRMKETESKQQDQNNDENEAMLQHVLDQCEKMQQEHDALKAKVKKLQNELNEKDKKNKTLSDAYNWMTQQMRNDDDEKGKESKDDLSSFLSSSKYRVNLMVFYDLFRKEGFDDFEMFTELTDDDLNEVGIHKKAQRMKILRGITIWKSSQKDTVDGDHKNEGSHTTRMFI